jgi:hypothetical protein
MPLSPSKPVAAAAPKPGLGPKITAAKPATTAPAGPGAKDVLEALAGFKTELFDKFDALDKKVASIIANAKAAGAAPAAAKSVPTKPAGPAAGATAPSATTPSAKPASAAKPATAPATSAAGDQPLESMSRKQLGDMARAAGIDPTGLKAEELRKKLADHGGGEAAAEEEGGEDNTLAKANILMALIEGNYDALAANLEGEVNLNPAEGETYCLGCGGDCPRCPHPEFGTPAEQINACFTSVHESLGLEVPAV